MLIRNALGAAALIFALVPIGSCTRSRGPEPTATRAKPVFGRCAEKQISGVSPSDTEVAAHREFPLPTIDYPAGERPDEWGLPLTLQVDASGQVVCYLAEDLFGQERVINQRRGKLFETASGWRYRPFVRDGKPVPAIVREQIYEQIHRTDLEGFPEVPLSSIAISLSRSGCYGACPTYSVDVHGDGEVVYTGDSYVDVLGRHTFRVPKEEVAELVRLARRDGVWGLSGSYRAPITDNPTYQLKLQVGPSSREIEDYVGEMAGMPKVITQFEEAVDRVGRTAQWTRLSLAAIERLRSEGFDFTSKEAGDLLARALANEEGNDQRAMLRLIELGAPLSGDDLSGPMLMDGKTSAIEQALLNHREQVVRMLLNRGALETDGRTDQEKLDKAFRDAIRGGRVALVEEIWNQADDHRHPALAFEDRDTDDETKASKPSPVTLLLSKPYRDTAWQGLEIAKWLAEKGCDLKAHGANGDTLLHIAVRASDLEFARYLLDQGLDPSAPGRFGLPALGSATDEDIALLLLKAGSGWQMDDHGKAFLNHVEDQHWGRVMAWIAAHPQP